MIISSTSSGNIQSANIPDAPSGSITLRVRDNQHQAGNTTLSTFNVDHLYIRVYSATGQPPPANPPADPSGMTAEAASSSSINLGWTDASNDELGFRVERSPDGLTGWVEIADLGAGTQSHGDAGLEAATQYFYRVSAYNSNGSSDYAEANATTDSTPQPPPPTAIDLSASGYKDRGKHGVMLDWTGAVSVDVYRDGAKIASAVSGGRYDDRIGQKGTITYEHQVCAAGGTVSCSNVISTSF
jgi:hypothetical protein